MCEKAVNNPPVVCVKWASNNRAVRALLLVWSHSGRPDASADEQLGLQLQLSVCFLRINLTLRLVRCI